MYSNAICSQIIQAINCVSDNLEIEPQEVYKLLNKYAEHHLGEMEWLRMRVVLDNWEHHYNKVAVHNVEDLVQAFTTKSDDEQADFNFEMHEEDYENGIQYLSIFDKTGARFEIRVWKDILDYEAFLKVKEAKVNDDQLYKMVVHYTTLERTANSWKEIRQR